MSNLKKQLQQAIDIRELYETYLGPLGRANDRNEVLLHCPWHGDENASLSINLRTGLFKCFGCNEAGDIFSFYMKQNGVDFKTALEQLADKYHIDATSNGLGQMEACYDYTDGKGETVFQVCRFPGKQIRCRQPNGNGWTWNLKGVEPVPYNLPGVMNTSTVYVVEGEKDANTLIDLGFCATTNSGGAGNWKPVLNEYFRNKRVVIIPDNDEPGRAHAQKIAMSLATIAPEIKVVDLPGLPEKGDVTDWLQTLSTQSRIRKQLCLGSQEAVTPVWQPKKDNGESTLLDIIERAAITSTDFINEDIPIPRTIIDPWMVDGSISMLYAKRGVGKTWLSLILSMAITREDSIGNKAYDVGPWSVTNRAGVLYVDGEMGQADLQYRMKRLSCNMGREDQKHPLILLSSNRITAKYDKQIFISHQEWRETLYEYLLKHEGINLVVLDNIASLSPGIDENIKSEWDAVNQWLLAIKAINRAVLLVHHAGKEGQQRGTSGREDNLDVVIKLKNPSGYSITDGAYFIVEFEKARNVPPKANLQPFTLKITDDGRGGSTWVKDKTLDETELITALLLDDKLKYRDIADLLGCSTGLISTIKSKAVAGGLIDKRKVITSKGKKLLNELRTKHDLETYYEAL